MPRFQSPVPLLPLWILAALAVGCYPAGDTAKTTLPSAPSLVVDPHAPIAVAATVAMVGDLVRIVGGDRVEVTQIMGAGVDPHLYRATRDDVQTIMDADVVFYCGLMLEGKMIDTLIKMAHAKPIIGITETLEEEMLLEPANVAGHYDPHVWMDVTAWSKCAQVIADELSTIDPPSESSYRERAKRLRGELAKLDEYGKRAIATIPAGSRVLVTSHDAFQYFGRAYGLEVMGVQGISTESEAGLQRINELVDLLVDKKVKSVFVESSVPRKNIESLVEGAKSRGHQVQIAAQELYSDAMGKPGTYEGTYIGMLDHNITVVARGLGGDAPENGFQGKLNQ